MAENKIEKLTREYQAAQERQQALALQKAQLQQQKNELEEAKKRIEASEGKIFYQVGGAIVETKKEEALSNIAEKTESVEMRLSIVSKQYNEASAAEQKIREELRSLMQPKSGVE
ncbi:MAG: prefoldin subunit [Candidatus Micrarchaeaceae archaeon]